ncbi:hypothetical protein SUNI508_07204 [Seiridium unicorne]|uniref:BTB domain-containing protein n=1 Tax=Seiridium unicorne TaxID=138068 RepID=A0ABR2UYG7_9PEZI
MAPQKGGQATKQHKQQQSAGAGGNKKPASAAAPAARPAVVPAIPLPMMQRQASIKGSGGGGGGSNASRSKQPTLAAASSGRYPVASLEAALIVPQATADSQAMPRHKQRRSKQKNEVNANGTHVEKPGSTATTNGEHNNNNTSTKKQHHDRQHSLTNGTDHQDLTSANHGANGLTNGVAKITFGDNARDPTTATASSVTSAHVSTAPSVAGDAESVAGSTSLIDPHNGKCFVALGKITLHASPVSQSLLHRLTEAATVQPMQPRTTTESTTFSTPNNARPAAHGNDALMHPAPESAALHALHRPHPNGAGIMFGGVPTPDSHTPSPASGAFMPPPPRPLMNGDYHKMITTNGRHVHHEHTDSNGTNFAFPITPYRPVPDHVTTMDSYGPVPAPVPVHRAHPDGYPPSANYYEPPTPHSFHGSHASADFNGPDNIVPFHPNGHGFDHDHRNGRPHGSAHMQPFMAPQQFPRRPSLEEELMDSVIFFQNQFDSAELADCTLELKYPDGYNHPVKINAHKLILARSAALKQYIMIARAADPGSHVITVNATDPYLRSDAWYTAVQRLYLHPLFSPPPTANGADFAGSTIDKFRFCLGYAAAGHLLEMDDVLIRGLQIAAGMINWHNIEEALGFAFEGATHRHFVGDNGHDYPVIDFAYGGETRMLMGSITSFLINYFPPNFDLDTAAIDPPNFARIPATTSTYQQPGKSAPAIARGTSVQKHSKSNRVSVIKFGDLPTAYPEDDNGSAPREPAKCSPQLSRILLNLPFEDLRYVLTSGTSSPRAWNTAQDRYHAMADVVAEREARRLRAVEAIRAGVVPGSAEIRQRLSAHRRYDMVDAWDVLNWQEEIVQASANGVPGLVRTWIPQFGVPPETMMEREPMYEPNRQESMV